MDIGQYLSLPDFNRGAGRPQYHSLTGHSRVTLLPGPINTHAPRHHLAIQTLSHFFLQVSPPEEEEEEEEEEEAAAGVLRHGDSSSSSRGSFRCALGRQLRRGGLEGRGGSAAAGRGGLDQVPRLLPRRCQCRRCPPRYLQIACLYTCPSRLVLLAAMKINYSRLNIKGAAETNIL
jgi:hypothetical protein